MRIINCHTHTFTLDHVPDKVFSWLPISWARKSKLFEIIIKYAPRVFRSKNDFLDRYASMLAIMELKLQENVLVKLISYYPKETRFVILSMDMEHMDAGKSKVSFKQQLNELSAIKKKYTDLVYPFICADPRNPDITQQVKEYILNHNFAGIKLYPALGFYPFDERLHEVYKFAIENNIPIITHCAKGVIYDRARIKPENKIHPITGEIFTETSKRKLTTHYTDPKNFDYLMDKSMLQIYMDKYHSGKKAPDFSKLKICFAHFGGEEEWENYLLTPWNPLLEKNNKNTNWFSDICDIIKKYENAYADISYLISEKKTYPLLKLLIEEGTIAKKHNYTSDDNLKKIKLSERILFGTDFFLVEQKDNERNLTIELRSFLGYENFMKIANHNPKLFLNIS